MKHFIFLLFFIPLSGISQFNNASWGVSDTLIYLSKTTDFGPVHYYIEVFNNSGQDLQMRWRCLEPVSWPSLWITNFKDTENDYSDVQNLDSADFTLLDPPGWANKLIIGVQHQSYAFTDTVSFKVWPLNYPEDSITVHYVFIIAQGDAWASINENTLDLKYLFDEENKTLQLGGTGSNADVKIYSLTGQLIYSNENYKLEKSELIELSNYTNEMLLVHVNSENDQYSIFKIIPR